MSTVADVLPYMQHWLDARTAQGPLVTAADNARTTMNTARAAVTARVVAGDTAIQMTAVMTTYVTARTAYLSADAAMRAARATTEQRFQTLEQMVELLAQGQTVPPFPV